MGGCHHIFQVRGCLIHKDLCAARMNLLGDLGGVLPEVVRHPLARTK